MTPDPRIKTVLLEAADILDKPGAWIQGASARNHRTGHAVRAYSPLANCFCAEGAIQKATFEHKWLGQGVMLAACNLAAFTAGETHLYRFNDAEGRTQAEVVAVLRKAAESLP